MTTITLNNTSFYYEQTGQAKGAAPSLLLLSGLTTNTSSWARLLPYLQPHFHITMMDNRGAGQSSMSDAEYTTQSLAGDVAALIQALDLTDLTVLGHSFGAAITQQLLIHHPECVKAAVLCNARAEPRPVFKAHIESLNELAGEGVERRLLLNNAATFLFSDEFFKDQNNLIQYVDERVQEAHPISPLVYLAQVQATTTHHTLHDLHRVQCPVLWVAGAEDIIALPAYAERGVAELKQGELHVMQGCAHMPHYEKPQQLAQLVIDFSVNKSL